MLLAYLIYCSNNLFCVRCITLQCAACDACVELVQCTLLTPASLAGQIYECSLGLRWTDWRLRGVRWNVMDFLIVLASVIDLFIKVSLSRL